MRLLILICLIAISSICFAQPKLTQLADIPTGEIPIGGADAGGTNGNASILYNASTIPAVAPSGYTGNNAQTIIDQLATNITNGGDGWGATVVQVAGNIITGDGAGTPLNLDLSQIGTGALNNTAGFITSPDDADASADNEKQDFVSTGNSNVIGLTLSNTTIDVREGRYDDCITASGSTVTLTSAIVSFDNSRFTINGVEYQASATSSTQLQVSGTTLQAGSTLGFPIEASDLVCYDYVK